MKSCEVAQLFPKRTVWVYLDDPVVTDIPLFNMLPFNFWIQKKWHLGALYNLASIEDFPICLTKVFSDSFRSRTKATNYVGEGGSCSAKELDNSWPLRILKTTRWRRNHDGSLVFLKNWIGLRVVREVTKDNSSTLFRVIWTNPAIKQ